MTSAISAAIALAGLCTIVQPAAAGDDNGNFMIRVQGTYLDTKDHTKSMWSTGAGADLTTLGYSAETTKEILPTATLTYFFNKNISAELFCCFATTNINLLSNGNNVGNVAKTWLFPPAVTLQYHFTGLGAFKPYVGAGAQYIHYFSTGTGDNYLGAQSVKMSDSFGPVLQAGFDYSIGNGWYLNADVKKSFLDTTVSFANATTLGVQNVDVKHSVDPLTVSVGVGYRFNLEDLLGRRAAYEPLK